MDVTHLAGNLWIGSAPRDARDYREFDRIYFVAEEIPPGPAFAPEQARYYGFDDRDLDQETLTTARIAADSVTRDLIQGRRVLVTCAMGRNRSALVSALAMHMMTGMPGAEIAAFIAGKRTDQLGTPALSNDAFRAYLEALP